MGFDLPLCVSSGHPLCRLFSPTTLLFFKNMIKKIKNSPYQRAQCIPQRLQVTARQLSGKWLQYALSFGHQSSLTCRGRIAFGAEPCSGAWRFPSTESSNLSRRGTVRCGAGGWPPLLTDQMARELPQPWARPAAGPGLAEGCSLKHQSEYWLGGMDTG